MNDFTLIEDISELYDRVDEEQRPLHINKLQCGRRHCMATFDYGAMFVWGDNEVGQLGNRKRAFIESPFPKRKFEMYHNVFNIACGVDSAAAIVESLPPRKKNPNRKKKRVISMQEARENSDEAIKAQNMERMEQAKRADKESQE